jgi:hypothetical protein
LITVRELGNVEYYQQKGFQVVSEQSQPAGTWGALGPYWLATMGKKIELTAVAQTAAPQ